MPVVSWKTWARLAVAGCALLGVVACAPNSARTPLEPGLVAGEDRYDTLLRLGASARAAGDPAAAVSVYQQAIAQNRSRVDAYVLLGDALVEMKAYDDLPGPIRRRSVATATTLRRIAAMRGRCWG
ncbi:MAG: tetratricopeptide repeat protein [Geminicoccaceae bacterium]